MSKKILLGFVFAVLMMFFAGLNNVWAATLNFNPSTSNITVGQTFTIDINLDTQGASVDGADINSLHYNPQILQLQGSGFVAGTLMPITVANTANTSTGTLVFSQVTSGGNHFNNNGKLASVTFKAIATGTATVTIDFTAGNTTKSVVASNGLNVLTFVGSGNYVVTGGSTPTPLGTPIPTLTPTPAISTNPPIPDLSQPKGYFDGITSTGIIQAWSYDPDSPSESNNIVVYIDGNLLFNSKTDSLRPDVNQYLRTSGNHGLAYVIPNQYKDTKTHTAYIYGVDLSDSNQLVHLTLSPRQFIFAANGLLNTPAPNSYSYSQSSYATLTPTPTPIASITPTPTATPDQIICVTLYNPVCGVNNVTYSNYCVAVNQNKVQVAHYGACLGSATPTPSLSSTPIPTPTPDQIICATAYNPVCGIDAKTYSNYCIATQQNKVQVAYYGVCTTTATPTPVYSPTNLRTHVIKSPDSPKIYYITEKGLKRWIPTEPIFLSYGNRWSDVIIVSQSQVESIQDNILIRLPGDSKVYKLDNNTKRWITTAEAFIRNNFQWSQIAPVNQTELNYYPVGDEVQ